MTSSHCATGGRTLLKQRHFGFIIKSCLPKTFITLTPFSQDTKYMALSHAELAAKLLQGEICAHGRTYLVGRYFQNETLRRPDTVQEKGK